MREIRTSGSMSGERKRSGDLAATAPLLDSTQGSGRAGLQPRRYKAFLIIPVPRAVSRLRNRAGHGTNGGRGPRFRRG